MITLLFVVGWFLAGCMCIWQERQKEKLRNQLYDYADWAEAEIEELTNRLGEAQRKAEMAKAFGLCSS